MSLGTVVDEEQLCIALVDERNNNYTAQEGEQLFGAVMVIWAEHKS